MENDQNIQKVFEWLKNMNIVPFEQIPEIDLYMDQLTTFIEERLKGYKRYNDDKILTKTMINNYTKDNVLPPPDKKKYNREQLAQLILIYHLKIGISINDISDFFEAAASSEIDMEQLYRAFTVLQQKEIEECTNTVKTIYKDAEELSFNDRTLQLFVILKLIVESNSRKQLAERLIDNLFENTQPLEKKDLSREKK